MVAKEEAVMTALVAIMGIMLVLLLLIPSALFVNSAEAVLNSVWYIVLPTSSTTTTTSSTITTTTSSTTTTSTTTSTESTTTTSSSETTSSTTTTTLKGKRCNSEADCGGLVVSELKCKGNTIWNYSTTYTCVNRGHPDSYCLGKPKNTAVLACDIYERCEYGRCITKYLNECDFACDDEGYGIFYCTNYNCTSPDIQMPLTKGPCSEHSRKCCCTDED
ncbi:MAG: hypothetical protein V1875_02465 [Candidatus Altiarchaeota archaeon]